MKTWRPRMYKGRVSITREGNFFAVACRSRREADVVQKALIVALADFRENLRHVEPSICRTCAKHARGDICNPTWSSTACEAHEAMSRPTKRKGKT